MSRQEAHAELRQSERTQRAVTEASQILQFLAVVCGRGEKKSRKLRVGTALRVLGKGTNAGIKVVYPESKPVLHAIPLCCREQLLNTAIDDGSSGVLGQP